MPSKRPKRAGRPSKRASIKPEPLTFPSTFTSPRKTPAVRMPMAGQDVLVRTEEDGLGGVPVQVARVLQIDARSNQVKVSYHGWSNGYDETITLDRLLHWDTAHSKALADKHVAEIEAIEEAARTAGGGDEGLKPSGWVTPPKAKGTSGIAQVTDYAIRQSSANGPFELMWYLMFRHKDKDGLWWSASACKAADPPVELSEEHGVVQIDASGRREGDEEFGDLAVTLLRSGGTIWVDLSELSAFISSAALGKRTLRLWKNPPPKLENKVRKKQFA